MYINTIDQTILDTSDREGRCKAPLIDDAIFSYNENTNVFRLEKRGRSLATGIIKNVDKKTTQQIMLELRDRGYVLAKVIDTYRNGYKYSIGEEWVLADESLINERSIRGQLGFVIRV